MINYHDAKTPQVDRLEAHVALNPPFKRADCSPEMLQKIRQGLSTANTASTTFEEYCEGKF